MRWSSAIPENLSSLSCTRSAEPFLSPNFAATGSAEPLLGPEVSSRGGGSLGGASTSGMSGAEAFPDGSHPMGIGASLG